MYTREGSLIVIALLVVLDTLLGISVYLRHLRDNKKEDKEKQVAQPEAVKKVLHGSMCVPPEIMRGARQRQMTQQVWDLMDRQYGGRMVGVPRVGEPFQLSLEPMPSEETLKAILEELGKEGPLVAVKTSSPPVLFAFDCEMAARKGVNFCPEGSECSPVDVWTNGVVPGAGYCS